MKTTTLEDFITLLLSKLMLYPHHKYDVNDVDYSDIFAQTAKPHFVDLMEWFPIVFIVNQMDTTLQNVSSPTADIVKDSTIPLYAVQNFETSQSWDFLTLNRG